MYPTSNSYKTEIKQGLRNPSYIRVNFNITDPQSISDATVITNGEMYWSSTRETISSRNVNTTYMTLERNRFPLTGDYRLPVPEGESQLYQGYVGNVVSLSSSIGLQTKNNS